MAAMSRRISRLVRGSVRYAPLFIAEVAVFWLILWAVDSSGYITPTMSDGPICVSMNREIGLAADMLAPRRTW